MAEDKYLLEIKNLSVEFKLRDKKNQTVKAVDHVSLMQKKERHWQLQESPVVENPLWEELCCI